ncbi:RNA 2',3'-cyclic phosphodiesterase [bacterium]|nr:MAG: RNA 2',3'-cyclic phosphodiesterase [bacterium]
MPRLFVAAWADEAVRARALDAEAALRARGLALRFYAPDQLHATMTFLGTVNQGCVGEIERACASVAAAQASFDLVIDRVGGFPSERRANVLWLGAGGEDAPFRAAARTLRERLADLGIALDEKEALPHVTIARAKIPVQLTALDVSPVRWAVREITLVESTTLPSGARYATLGTWRLGA